jgi:hypothetical protein
MLAAWLATVSLTGEFGSNRRSGDDSSGRTNYFKSEHPLQAWKSKQVRLRVLRHQRFLCKPMSAARSTEICSDVASPARAVQIVSLVRSTVVLLDTKSKERLRS